MKQYEWACRTLARSISMGNLQYCFAAWKEAAHKTKVHQMIEARTKSRAQQTRKEALQASKHQDAVRAAVEYVAERMQAQHEAKMASREQEILRIACERTDAKLAAYEQARLAEAKDCAARDRGSC